MKTRIAMGMLIGLIALGAPGCARVPESQYVSSPAVDKLSPPFQATIKKILAEQSGTPSSPRMPGGTRTSLARLKRGSEVYAQNCVQCHGVTGDGNGPAARFMLPRPRDYRPGIFKFTSTSYGAKPLREDLARTIRRGVLGTSMPAFDLLPAEDLEAVVDYVLSLTHRGELEQLLAEEAEFNGEIDEAVVPELLKGILKKWSDARNAVITPMTPQPDFTVAQVLAGRQAFQSKGCIQCHGPDGRGQTKDNIGVDGWGNPTKAADLTSGMLRGGTEPLDIYRHIDGGINGTPMPSFHAGLQGEPQTIWDLVSFVLYLSNERRRGVIPEAGLLKPLPGVEAAPPAEAVVGEAGDPDVTR